MTRYFFDIRDGEFLADRAGLEFADLEAARLHAVVRTSEILKENPSRFWDGEEWQMEVRDKSRQILFILTFMATNSPNLPARKLKSSAY